MEKQNEDKMPSAIMPFSCQLIAGDSSYEMVVDWVNYIKCWLITERFLKIFRYHLKESCSQIYEKKFLGNMILRVL